MIEALKQWFSPKHWHGLGELDAYAAFSTGLLTGIVTLISVLVAAWLTYRYAKKQSRLTHNVQIDVDQLRRKIEALEKIWTLLAYTSDRESDHTIFFWREKEGNPDKKNYYMHIGRLRELLRVRIGEVFFKESAGLFLPNNVRDLLFAYANKLMGLHLRYESLELTAETSVQRLKSERLYTELNQINIDLREATKAALKEAYEQLRM